jgi:general secretion pathway protein J
MHARRHKKINGFTLVEVLVALMVMALMAAMAWQGVDGVVRSRNDSQTRLEQTLRLNTVVAQWEQDLGFIQSVGVTGGLQFDGVSLRMTRSAAGGMQVVVWSLRPASLIGGSGGSPTLKGEVLQRWAGPVVTSTAELQDQWFRSLQFLGTEPGQLSAMSGLSTWQVYFYQGNAWANAQSTGNSASPGSGANPGSAGQALPNGVRLVLTFAEGSGSTGSLTRDIAMPPH